MNIKLTNKSSIGILLSFFCIFLLLISSLIYLRYEVAINDNNNRPINYKNFSNTYVCKSDYMGYKNSPFTTDEIYYFNFDNGKAFIKTFTDKLDLFLETGIPTNLNFYGFYIRQLSLILNNNWILLIYCTGVIYFIIFIILLKYILTKIININEYKAYILLTLTGISPPVLALSITWTRDLFLIDLMLLFLISIAKEKKLLAILTIIIQFLLRSYMLIPFFFIYLFVKNQDHKKLKILTNFSICLLLMFFLYKMLFYIPGRVGVDLGKIPFRTLETLTGLCGIVVKGNAKVRGGLFDLYSRGFEIFSFYYYFLMYSSIYFYLFFKRLICGNFLLNNKCLSFFLLYFFTGTYLGILHSYQLGFIMSRIKLIPFVLFIIFWGSCLGGGGRKVGLENRKRN